VNVSQPKCFQFSIDRRGEKTNHATQVVFDPFLYLETIGRKSFERRVVKLRFVPWRDENSVCVLGAFSGDSRRLPDWLLNILEGLGESRIVSKQIDGKITKATVMLDNEESNPKYDEERTSVLDAFSRKYEKEIVLSSSLGKYYQNSRPVILYFKPTSCDLSPKFPKRDKVTNLEFDIQAKNYTSMILGNPVSKWQRQVTIRHMQRIFRPGEQVLEIGCGTGIETIPLAKIGIKIVAVDISEKMLEILWRRAVKEGVEERITTKRLSSSNIEELALESIYPPGGFDGFFSTFGVANLEPDLRKFAHGLHDLLRPGANAVFGVWNKFCLTDSLASLFLGRISRIRQRISGFVAARVESRYSLDTRTYSPKEFETFFQGYFRRVSCFAVPALIIPPSPYLSKFDIPKYFGRADFAMGRLPLMRDIGDNFVITMRRL
jgi:SAM-dependent methyltransferase